MIYYKKGLKIPKNNAIYVIDPCGMYKGSKSCNRSIAI